jgi:hypothetical protein
LQYERSWDKSLAYAEFSYNNNYQESLKMAPFKMLYGRRCRTPLFWNETEEQKVFGPDILEEAKKQVHMVRENLCVTYRCISAYPFITVLSLLLPCIIILFLHLLSTNHKCTQPCYFPLLLKPVAQKERMNWNSLTRSSRLRVAPVVVPVVLWSLSLFRFVESHLSL